MSKGKTKTNLVRARDTKPRVFHLTEDSRVTVNSSYKHFLCRQARFSLTTFIIRVEIYKEVIKVGSIQLAVFRLDEE